MIVILILGGPSCLLWASSVNISAPFLSKANAGRLIFWLKTASLPKPYRPPNANRRRNAGQHKHKRHSQQSHRLQNEPRLKKSSAGTVSLKALFPLVLLTVLTGLILWGLLSHTAWLFGDDYLFMQAAQNGAQPADF